jgi:hypothetical protein
MTSAELIERTAIVAAARSWIGNRAEIKGVDVDCGILLVARRAAIADVMRKLEQHTAAVAVGVVARLDALLSNRPEDRWRCFRHCVGMPDSRLRLSP